MNAELSGAMHIEICRPKALIIMGTLQLIAKNYDDLSAAKQSKISKDEYNDESNTAYKELKEAFKNIHLMTYSELLDSARTRIIQEID